MSLINLFFFVLIISTVKLDAAEDDNAPYNEDVSETDSGESQASPDPNTVEIPEPQSKAGYESESISEVQPTSEREGDSGSGSEPGLEYQPASEEEGDSEAESEPGSEVQPASEEEGDSEAESEPGSELQSTSEEEGDPEAESNPASEPQLTPEPDVESEAEPTSEPATEEEQGNSQCGYYEWLTNVISYIPIVNYFFNWLTNDACIPVESSGNADE